MWSGSGGCRAGLSEPLRGGSPWTSVQASVSRFAETVTTALDSAKRAASRTARLPPPLYPNHTISSIPSAATIRRSAAAMLATTVSE